MGERNPSVLPGVAVRRINADHTRGGIKEAAPTGMDNRRGRANALLAALRASTGNDVRVVYSSRSVNILGPLPPKATQLEKAVLAFTSLQKSSRKSAREVNSASVGSCVSAALERVNEGFRTAFSEPLLKQVKNPDPYTPGRTDQYGLVDQFRSRKFTQLEKDLFDIIAYTKRKYETIYGTSVAKLWQGKTPDGRPARAFENSGIPGALTMLGYARIVKDSSVWNPQTVSLGTPLQFWGVDGHAAILERFVYDERMQVVGFCYSDQWYDYHIVRRVRHQRVFGGFHTVYAAKYIEIS